MNNIFINTSYIKTQPNPFQGRQIEAIQKSSFIDLKQWIQDRIDDGSIIAGGGGGASLPNQSGNAGKFLTTNGSSASWATVNSAVWGNITGTLSAQTDLNTALGLLAPLASPTFTGTVVLPSTTSIGTVDSTELSYLDGVTSAIQTQLDSKLATASFVPAGSNTQLQFNNSGAFGASANLTWNGTTFNVTGLATFTPATSTATSGTINSLSHTSTFAAAAGSANFRPLNISYTLNNSGVQSGNTTGIFLNATETNRNGMSHTLMDLQNGGISQFNVRRDGFVIIAGGLLNQGGYTGSSNSSSGTASQSITGTWFTGGTSTTTKPHVLIEPTGATSTNWNTSGTGLGVNSSSTFIGNLIDLQKNATSLFKVDYLGKPTLNSTVTAGGTTGNQTIDKPTGTVNIAAAGTTVTVTNATCTANSIVTAVIRTNDATAYIKNVVPSAGSFVINLGAAATAEVSIGFTVFN